MTFSSPLSRGRPGRVGLVALCAFVVGTAAVAAADPRPAERPWLDASKPIDQRVSALLSQMTLDEKIGQMTQIESDSVDPAGVGQFLLGSVLASGSGNPPGENTAQNWYAMVDGYQQAALGTRLGIPIAYGVDMVHGASHMAGTTIFPHNIGLGATRDPELVERSAGRPPRSRPLPVCAGPSVPWWPCPRMFAGVGHMRASARTPRS